MASMNLERLSLGGGLGGLLGSGSSSGSPGSGSPSGSDGFPGDIKFALMDCAPELSCRKMLEGREDWSKVEESRGGLRNDR